METYIELVLSEMAACVRKISTKSLDLAVSLIEIAPRIFVAGAGRSGLAMRAFGMRLMHLGRAAYVVSETMTPSIKMGNLLIIASGSGRTSSLVGIAKKARSVGAEILLFTTNEKSPLAELADYLVTIPAPSLKSNGDAGDVKSTQPMGSLFEQSLPIVCDSLILNLMERLRVDVMQMRDRHANME